MSFPVPTEILAQIVESTAADDATSLPSFALVNRACADLVRATRFTDIRLGENSRSLKLLAILAAEVLRSGDNTARPTIGPYIRKLTIRITGSTHAHADRLLLKSWQGCLGGILSDQHHDLESPLPGEEETRQLCRLLERHDNRPRFALIESEYRVFLANVILAMKLTMPNLKTLDWNLDIDLAPDLRRGFADSLCRLDHVQLRMPALEWIKLEIEPTRLTLQSLNLSLYYISKHRYYRYDNEVNLQRKQLHESVSALLRAIAPTVHDISLDLHFQGHTGGMQPLKEFVPFPALRTLDLRSIDVAKDLFPSLVNSPTTHLKISTQCERHHDFPFQDGIGNMPRLQSLDFTDLFSGQVVEWVPDAVDFLGRHTSIKYLRLAACEPDDLEEGILPCISGGAFTCLSSLALTWFFKPDYTESRSDGDRLSVDISPGALTAIGQIRTLEQLSLTAVTDEYEGLEWKINHIAVRDLFQGLQNLRLLALIGDSWVDRFDAESYYTEDEVVELELRDLDENDQNVDEGTDYDQGSDEEENDSSDEGTDEEEDPLPTSGSFMFGSLRDMIALRARPELDDYIFEQDDYPIRHTWKPETAAEDQRPELVGEIGPVRDRYCFVPQYNYFDIIKRNCVLAEAENWAAIFPHLRTVYFGEILMTIKQPGVGWSGNAVPVYPSPVRRKFPTTIFDMGYHVAAAQI